MFTGIVQAQGRVIAVKKARGNRVLTLRVPAAFRKAKLGASISADGVCLTVTARKGSDLFFDIVPETLRRTHFSGVKPGDALNLERPLVWKGHVDGHIVQGHVDGTARITKVSRRGKGLSFGLKPPKSLKRYLIEKGSVTLNGISLTVGKVSSGLFWVHIIPHTLKKTNIRFWKLGQKINLETDWLLKTRNHK